VRLGRHFGDSIADILAAVAWVTLGRDGRSGGRLGRLRGIGHIDLVRCEVLREMNGRKYMIFRHVRK
jgi:hypothetical protein